MHAASAKQDSARLGDKADAELDGHLQGSSAYGQGGGHAPLPFILADE